MSLVNLKSLLLFFAFLLILPLSVSPGQNTLNDDPVITVIIGLKQSQRLFGRSLPNSIYYRPQKVAELMDSNNRAYRNVIQFANRFNQDERIIEITPIWIANSLVVSAKESFISKLAKNEMVETINKSRTIRIIDPEEKIFEPIQDGEENPDIDSNYTYGLNKIGIPELVKEYPNALGTRIRVGHIDTGVNPNHQDLKGKVITFRDFVNGRQDAYDDNDHGTHTAGTIAGGSASGTRIGVAPGVELIVAKVFDNNGSGDEANLLKAMQWIADPDGDPNTPDGPVVVSNSWGGSTGTLEQEKPFSDAVKNWVSLGIFPCFAAGNAGPNAGTVSTPGGYAHSFSVGASDENDLITEFSSRGPFKYGDDDKQYNKPDVSAPGNRVYSAIANGKWAKMSGTSMATPHVAGLVALINEAKPKITTEEVGRILTQTAKDIDLKGYDFNAGWGRVDAYKAIKKILGVNQEEEDFEEYLDELAMR